MPKIKVAASTPVTGARAVSVIRKATGLSFSSVANRLSLGKSGWLLTADLFKGDHEDREREVREVISGLKSLGVEPFILYAATSESWEEVLSDPDTHVLSPEATLKILDKPNQEFD